MKREFRFARFFTPLLCPLLSAGASLLTGCTDSRLAADEENPAPAIERRTRLVGTSTSKLRHAPLLDQARRTTAGKRASSQTVGLLISIDKVAITC